MVLEWIKNNKKKTAALFVLLGLTCSGYLFTQPLLLLFISAAKLHAFLTTVTSLVVSLVLGFTSAAIGIAGLGLLAETIHNIKKRYFNNDERPFAGEACFFEEEKEDELPNHELITQNSSTKTESSSNSATRHAKNKAENSQQNTISSPLAFFPTCCSSENPNNDNYHDYQGASAHV